MRIIMSFDPYGLIETASNASDESPGAG